MKTLSKNALRTMIIEALSRLERCPDCEEAYDMEENHSCSMDESDAESELDEFSGAGAVAGYTMPLGMRPPGPRSNIANIARRSFGGIDHKKKKSNR